MAQVVSLSFFRFEGWRNKWWGFKQMGLAPAALKAVPGLSFVKMMGSGGGNGFSIRPNFGVYGLLSVWENEAYARDFFAQNAIFQEFCQLSAEQWTIFLHPAKAHGLWDGQEPFQVQATFDPSAPVAVLTRATIRTSMLWQFWRFVPAVSRAMWREHHEGLHFSIGIGELPLVQQATFSLWQDSQALQAYAYRGQHHSAVVRKTRELNWYKEELFARFHPFDSFGSWKGVDPWEVVRKGAV